MCVTIRSFGSCYCCDVNCSGIDEDEQCGEDENSGCDDPGSQLFTSISCGETVCGTIHADGGDVDHDWYEFTVVDSDGLGDHVEITLEAAFTVGVALVGISDCNNPVELDFIQTFGCNDGETFTKCLSSGTYALKVYPTQSDGTEIADGLPCGTENTNEYSLTLSCLNDCPTGICCQCLGCCEEDVTQIECENPALFNDGKFHEEETCVDWPYPPCDEDCFCDCRFTTQCLVPSTGTGRESGAGNGVACRYGCLRTHNPSSSSVGYSYGYGHNARLDTVLHTPNFPPRKLDVVASSSPLIPADAGHSGRPTAAAERPTDRDFIDLITGSRVYQETDFELDFGGATFRHIRTNSDSYDTISHGGGYRPERDHWDWNGQRWMMSENPIFLMDASPGWNYGEPRKCYFIADAHHSIPFTQDPSTGEYTAPPWFDAVLQKADGTFNTTTGDWDERPTAWHLWLHRGSVEYTIVMDYRDVPDDAHVPSDVGYGISSTFDNNGVGYRGYVTKINDRYGHEVEISYCGDVEAACDYNGCPTTCENCNERGQIKWIKLKRPMLNGQGSEVVWTLLYTHRAFGGTCIGLRERCDPPDPLCAIFDESLDNYGTMDLPHMLHTIHVYEGDKDVSDTCLTLSQGNFCHAVDLDAYENAPLPSAVTDDWVMEARYVYSEFFNSGPGPVSFDLKGETCPITCAYDEGVTGSYVYDVGLEGAAEGTNLLKVTVTRKEENDTGEETLVPQYSMYHYFGDTAYIEVHSFFAEGPRLGFRVYRDNTIQEILRAQRDQLGDPDYSVNDLLDLNPDEDSISDPQTGRSRLLKNLADLSFEPRFPFDCDTEFDPDCPELENLMQWCASDPLRTRYGDYYVLSDQREGVSDGGTYVYHLIQEFPVKQDPNCELYPVSTMGRKVGIWSEHVHFPYRSGSWWWETPCSSGPYSRLMENGYGGKRFYIMLIDELEENVSPLNGNQYQPYSSANPQNAPLGVRSRRMVELNAAGFVLRDRTWSYETDGTGMLVDSTGYGEENLYDCAGRIIERRSPGWSVTETDEIQDNEETDGLIEIFEYDDRDAAGQPVDLCNWDGTRCDCDVPGTNNNLKYRGELTRTGIKKGTNGTIYYRTVVERHPDRPEFITKQIKFSKPELVVDPLPASGLVTEIEYTLGSGPIEKATIVGKKTIQPAVPGTLGGTPRYAVEKAEYDNAGNMTWHGVGSLIDSSSFNVQEDEFFVDQRTYDRQGRVTEIVVDTDSAMMPADFQRISETTALNLTTEFTYSDGFELKKTVFPNGREQHIVYVQDLGSADHGLFRWTYNDLLPVGHPENPTGAPLLLSPVQVNYMEGSKLTWSRQLKLTAPNTYPPDGTEAPDVNIISEATPEYDETGRLVGMSREGENAEGVSASIGYNAFGELDRQYDPSGMVSRFAYDERGRIKKVYRGTSDQHLFWGTAAEPEDECEPIPNDCAQVEEGEEEHYCDNLVLVEKRYYGQGITNTGRLTGVRRYRDMPDNQYFYVVPECDPPLDPVSENNEDNIGWIEKHEYDWRMRDVFVEQQDDQGNALRHTLTWYDHLDRVRYVAEYGPTAPEGSAADPRTLNSSVTLLDFAPVILSNNPPPLMLMENVYNDRGQVEETRHYDVNTPDGSSYTANFSFFDHADRSTESILPNSPRRQSVYDAKGREVISRVRVVNDLVMSQTNTVYDKNDRMTQTIHRERLHDSTTDTDLDNGNSIATYTHFWYDSSGRRMATAEFGTNSPDSTFTNGPAPAAYNPLISPAKFDAEGNFTACDCDPAQFGAQTQCSCFEYDKAGRQSAIHDPGGKITRTEYDGLGRTLLTTVSDYQKTAYKYDGNGRLTHMAAVRPDHNLVANPNGVEEYNDIDWSAVDGTLQITKIIYGAEVVNQSGAIESQNNDWIREVHFPSVVNGQPDPFDNLTFRYYSDGQIADRIDQRSIVFTYKYDELDRHVETIVDDSAWYPTATGYAPDRRVSRITYTYYPTGELSTVTAYARSETGEESLLAQNTFEYDDYRNLTREAQAHFVNVADSTPDVEYTWETSPATAYNFNRLKSMTYPAKPPQSSESETVTLSYGTGPTSIDSALSRITDIALSGMGSVASYQYAGTSRRVRADFGNGLYQTVVGGSGYPGLDQFGRLIDLHYQRSDASTVHRYEYGYDKVGNRLFSRVTQQDHNNDRSYLYTYDELNRLVEFDRGALNSTNDALLTGLPSANQTWSLDDLGNWSGPPAGVVIWEDTDGDGLPDLLDYLHHDVAANNELLGVQSGIDTTPMLVDKAGNLVDDGTYVYSYDAWNRVIEVHQRGSVVFDGDGAMLSGSPGGFVAGFAYDGLGRLIFKERPADETGFKPREHYYYDGVRRIQTIKRSPFFPLPDPDDPDTGVILEPPEGGGGGGGGGKGGPPIPQSPLPEWTVSLEREYVFGTDYVDEFILEYSSPGTPFYTLQDGNYNVVGIVDNSAAVRKQYTYSPYGRLIASESYGAALYTQHGFQGLFLHRYNAGTSNQMLVPNAPGIYYNRNRTYHPTLGRFLQRDPNASGLSPLDSLAMHGETLLSALHYPDPQTLYSDGANLFEYVASNPVNLRDPLGLSFDEDIDALIGDYESSVADVRGTLHQAMWMIREGAWSAQAYIHAAFAWDDLVWDLSEQALFDLVGGSFFARACFEAGTLVWMADGTYKPIEQLRSADRVACADAGGSGEVIEGGCSVARRFRRVSSQLVPLEVESNGTLASIVTTPEHPFFSADTGTWVTAGSLRAGSLIETNAGTGRVVCQETLAVPSTVYNIEVDDAHTYFVSKARVWVHNACVPEFAKQSPRNFRQWANQFGNPNSNRVVARANVQEVIAEARKLGYRNIRHEIGGTGSSTWKGKWHINMNVPGGGRTLHLLTEGP